MGVDVGVTDREEGDRTVATADLSEGHLVCKWRGKVVSK